MAVQSRRALLRALGATAGLVLGLGPTRQFPARAMQGPVVRILPVGDSLTRGSFGPYAPSLLDGGYRTRLWRRLCADGFRVDFVGNQRSGPFDIDREHEGHSRWTTADVYRALHRRTYEAPVDVILLMIGTSDILRGADLDSSLRMVNSFLTDNFFFGAHYFVASIPPLVDPRLETRAATLRDATRIAVERLAYQDYGPTWIDTNAALDPFRHLAPDGVHLNPAGYDVLADLWYEALAPILRAWLGRTGVGVEVPHLVAQPHSIDGAPGQSADRPGAPLGQAL